MVFKTAALVAAALSLCIAAAHAADPAPTTANGQPVGEYPSLSQSYARLPGPKVGPSTWIPAASGPAVAPSPQRLPGPKTGTTNWIPPSPHYQGASGDDPGSHPYSQHGTGPMPN
jgi:hypothetical protein